MCMSDNIDKAVIKQKILEEIEKVSSGIISLTEEAQPISPENAIGRVSRMDAINNKSVVEAALAKAKEKLSKLQGSLDKVDSPNFGFCARCSQPIQLGRLMYMPESSRCVHCADK